MSKLSRELKNEIESLHLSDYDRGSWGEATSTPYQVKTYLTPAQSERIKAAYEALRGRVEAKLAETPKSKQEERSHHFEYADFLFDSPDAMNLLEGETLRGWRLCARTLDHIEFRNGRGHYELRPYSLGDVTVDGYANRRGYPSYSSLMHLQLYWDAERRLYYVLEWERASTQPVREGRRRRIWARAGKRREFLGECAALRERLTAAGVEIKGVVRDGGVFHDKIYIDCAAPDATVDLSGRDAGKAWNSHPVVVGPAEPGPVQEGPRVSEPAQSDEHACFVGTVCFTGKLERLLRQEAAVMAKRAGYDVVSSVSRGLTYLVTNDFGSASTKSRKADEYGIKKITEAEFMALVGKAGETAQAVGA